MKATEKMMTCRGCGNTHYVSHGSYVKDRWLCHWCNDNERAMQVAKDAKNAASEQK